MAYQPTVWSEGDLITSTKLNKIEQGIADNTGKDGISPTITIGEVTEGDSPSVTNSGTESAIVLDFVLPKGEKGETGAAGTDGKSVQSIELVKDSSGAIISGTVTFTDESTAPITITTQES